MLAFVFASPASAATFTVGRLELWALLQYQSDPGQPVLTLVEADTKFVNLSPVTLLDVNVTAQAHNAWDDSSLTSHNVLAPGSSSIVGTRAITLGQPGALGAFLYGSASGVLSSSTFLLPDGNAFVANTPAFSLFIGAVYAPDTASLFPFLMDIVVEGTIVPGGGPTDPPVTPVPEPATLTMLLSGTAIASWRARRCRNGRTPCDDARGSSDGVHGPA
jgi:hypothetical protein